MKQTDMKHEADRHKAQADRHRALSRQA